MYADGGFDLTTVKKETLDKDHYKIIFDLGPKQAFGYVLPSDALNTDTMD